MYLKDIEADTIANSYFRTVIYTDERLQLVLMSLAPGEEIGMETHDLDQFIRIEQGEGRAVLNGDTHELRDGAVVVVPKGISHNIINTSSTSPLKLYTIYTPPNHPKGTIHRTKLEADAAERG